MPLQIKKVIIEKRFIKKIKEKYHYKKRCHNINSQLVWEIWY